MFHWLRGTLKAKSPASMVVEVGGIGFFLHIPLSTYNSLPEEGEEVKVYTELVVREDRLSLYGFFTLEEKDFFLLLTSLPKVGPQLALKVLSETDFAGFSQAVREENISFLTQISGVGEKTAQRMILELKEKLGGVEIGKEGKVFTDALSALTSLGYPAKEARKALSKVFQEKKDLPLEEVVKRALGYL